MSTFFISASTQTTNFGPILAESLQSLEISKGNWTFGEGPDLGDANPITPSHTYHTITPTGLLNITDIETTNASDGVTLTIQNVTANTVTFTPGAGSGKILSPDGIVTLDTQNDSVSFVYTGVEWLVTGVNSLGGGGAGTDLAYTAAAGNGTVTSSTGTDAIIPLADDTNAGLLQPGLVGNAGDVLTVAGGGGYALSTPTTDLAYTAAVNQGTVTSSTGTDAVIPLTDGTNAGLLVPGPTTSGGVGLRVDGTSGGWVVDAGIQLATAANIAWDTRLGHKAYILNTTEASITVNATNVEEGQNYTLRVRNSSGALSTLLLSTSFQNEAGSTYDSDGYEIADGDDFIVHGVGAAGGVIVITTQPPLVTTSTGTVVLTTTGETFDGQPVQRLASRTNGFFAGPTTALVNNVAFIVRAFGSSTTTDSLVLPIPYNDGTDICSFEVSGGFNTLRLLQNARFDNQNLRFVVDYIST